MKTKPPARHLVADGGAYEPVEPAFLGRGWSFPPSFIRSSASVTMAGGDTDIRQSLWIILSTSLGERIMLATFGCDLMSKVFTALTTTTANEISTMVTRAIIEWEPRVTVESVTVTDSELDGWLDISIDYIVRETNSRSNLVYPYCRMEATLPPPAS
ncbi:MAG: GPW/gp25 family protein [Novosphingobium sp.]